jgi:amino acid transporter
MSENIASAPRATLGLTGSRVTFAMGRDDELAVSLGVLHTKNLAPGRAIWTLCGISAITQLRNLRTRLCSEHPAEFAHCNVNKQLRHVHALHDD